MLLHLKHSKQFPSFPCIWVLGINTLTGNRAKMHLFLNWLYTVLSIHFTKKIKICYIRIFVTNLFHKTS